MQKNVPLIIVAFLVTFCFGTQVQEDHSKNILDRFLLDPAIRNAGGDPESPEAKAAKKLGRDWLNPFASEQEIMDDIERIKHLIINTGNEEQARHLAESDLTTSEKREKLIKMLNKSRVCPICRRRGPLDWAFCPYDGSRLRILNPSEVDNSPHRSISKPSRILLMDKMTGWDGQDYMRLLEIGAKKNIEVVLATGYNAKPDILDGNFDGIIIFGGGGGSNDRSYGGTSAEQLVDLQLFTKKGGRLAFFCLPRMTYFNDELRNLFKISVGSDYSLTPRNKEVISVDGTVLASFWANLEVGSKKSYEKDLGLRVYFASLDPQQVTTSAKNQEGELRKLSVMGSFGEGKYIFISSFSTGGGGIACRNIGNILHDGNIFAWDNEAATDRLLGWLVSR